MSCELCSGTGFIIVAEEPLAYDSASTYEPCPQCFAPPSLPAPKSDLLEAAACEEKIKEVSQEIGRLTEALSQVDEDAEAAEASTVRLVELLSGEKP